VPDFYPNNPNFDLNRRASPRPYRAECRTQDAEFSGPQIPGTGYFVTTVGRDEEVIRAYIRNQELAEQQLDQLELKISAALKSNQSSKHPLKPPLAVPIKPPALLEVIGLVFRSPDVRTDYTCCG
jgi:hypothetical protein